MIKFLDLNRQYNSIKNEIDNAISSVIERSAFVGGEFVERFEQQFGRYVGCNFCVGVGNGTDALEIAIEALNLPDDAEIIVPANSFIASSEAITRQGLRVVFADCDEDSYFVSVTDVERKISDKTRALLVVHLYGHPCDMDPLKRLADERGLFIIEDCAQAHGAKYFDRTVGSIGDIAAFSFYPGKNLGAYGDGGAITTNCEQLANRCRKIANHGRIGKYDHEFEGRNSRLDGMQAAILSVKLSHLDEWTNQRIRVAELYSQELSGVSGVKLPIRREWALQVYHLFVIRTAFREDLQEYLRSNGIATGIHYPIALPKLPAYTSLNQAGSTPTACAIDSQLLSLPIGEHVSLEDAKAVSDAIKTFFS